MLIIQRPSVEALGEEAQNRQRFAVSPLEPGFGHTLGNSLRRTLLSSIPGAAVTQIRFDDALHEFTTLPGVKDDVTDIILNLKDVVLRVHSDESVTLRLDKRGPGDATAGDLQCTAEVEVLNPDLRIATLNGKGRLAVDVTVERGRGYVSAERNKHSSTIGVIPIDSIFSPVTACRLLGGAGARRAVHGLRPPRARHRDRRLDQPPRSPRFCRRHAPFARLARCRPRRGAPRSRARRSRERGQRFAGPRPADRGPRPLRAPAQLPQARSGQHDRRARRADRRRPARHHELRAEVARRGYPETGRAWLVLENEGLIDVLGTPKKGRRLGGDAAHQRAMLGNLVASLIAAESLVTTQTKAKAMRPVVEKCVTAAKKQLAAEDKTVHQQRRVVALIRDKDMAHKLFTEIAPRYADRPGGYTRILKLGPRQGDAAPMARIEFV